MADQDDLPELVYPTITLQDLTDEDLPKVDSNKTIDVGQLLSQMAISLGTADAESPPAEQYESIKISTPLSQERLHSIINTINLITIPQTRRHMAALIALLQESGSTTYNTELVAKVASLKDAIVNIGRVNKSNRTMALPNIIAEWQNAWYESHV
jgi:hypothetical protein